MKQFLPVLSVALVVALTIMSGLIHGNMSRRWGTPENLLAAGERLEEFPTTFGKWQMKSSETVGDNVITTLECAGYISRTYQNQERPSERIRVAVFLGPSQPISLHTAEICYSSRHHKIIEERNRGAIPGSDDSKDQFWALTFQSKKLDAALIRVYYAWNTGSQWTTLDESRLMVGRHPYLYKIQLAAHLPPGTDLKDRDPCQEFLEDFVPVAKSYLIEPSEK